MTLTRHREDRKVWWCDTRDGTQTLSQDMFDQCKKRQLPRWANSDTKMRTERQNLLDWLESYTGIGSAKVKLLPRGNFTGERKIERWGSWRSKLWYCRRWYMSKNLLIVTCDTRCKSRREYQYQLSLSISNINDERQRDKRNLPNRTNFYNETLRHNQLIQVTVENDVKIKSQQPLQGVNTILKESERRKPRERITVDAAKEC